METERLDLINLFVEHQTISIDDVISIFKYDRKKLWYNIERINDSLKALDLETIEMRQKKIHIPRSLVDYRDRVINMLNDNYLIVPKKYRCSFVFLYILLSPEHVSVNHLEHLLNVSRNTVLNTIKDVRLRFEESFLTLDYTRENGYQILGGEAAIRDLIQSSLHEISYLRFKESYLARLMDITRRNNLVFEVANKLNHISNIYEIEFVSERYQEFIYLFTIILCKQPGEMTMDEDVINYFKEHRMWTLSKELCIAFGLDNITDIAYFTIRLLTAVQGGSEDVNVDESLRNITYAIIDNINELSYGALEIRYDSDLPRTLYQHLVPSYYRLKYNIPLSNPYTESIRTEYDELFRLVEKALDPLAKISESSIPEEEIAYFTVHFGGYLASRKEKKTIRAITVCPNGITSSLLLKIELQKLFDDIKIIGSYSSDVNIDKLGKEYDVIFSTAPIYSEKPVFVMKPIMNWVEREILIKQVSTEFGLDVSNYDLKVSSFLEIIEKHTTIHDKDSLVTELGSLIFKDKRGEEENSLIDLLGLPLMQITNQKMTWEEAIQFASKPLLEEGYIAQSYVDAMISKVKEIGPYIVLAPKVAIPHARPEDGAQKLGVSFLKSKETIKFDVDGNEKDVNLIFVLSAVDNLSHLTALQELSYLLDDESNIDAMIQEDDLEQLLVFIKEKSQEVQND